MDGRTVLVVEDDAAIRSGLVAALRRAGHHPLSAADAPAGRAACLRDDVDLVLLDLVLPGGDGLDLLALIRRERPDLPVIVLTARGDEADRVAGLRGGADDYVVKPFGVAELLARIDAVLRRCTPPPAGPAVVQVHGARFDLARRTVRWADGTEHLLSAREAALLGHLARQPGAALAREHLLALLWHCDPRAGRDSRAVDMLVARLRRKLPEGVLTTVRGGGYALVVEP